VFYGSLDFAQQVKREATWVPAPYGNNDYFKCSHYYPYLGNHLLAESYTMMPIGDVHRLRHLIFQRHGDDDTIFIRPDSGGKIFTGRLLYKESLDHDLDYIGYDTIPESEMVVISSPRNIKAEWRFVVADNKVIAGSQYRRGGQKSISDQVDPKALKLAGEIASIGYQPARIYTMDICQTLYGHFYLLEINS